MDNGGNPVRALAAPGTTVLNCRGIGLLYRGGGVMDHKEHEEEGVLSYKCPDSGHAVRTSIVTTDKTLKGLGAFKISVWCPHCGAPHQIAGKDASLIRPLPAG